MKTRKRGGNPSILIPVIAIGIGVVVGVFGSLARNYHIRKHTRRNPTNYTIPFDNNRNPPKDNGVLDVNNTYA